MHKEENEKRDFLPDFFIFLKDENIDIYLETGYGSGMHFTEADYLNANPKINFISHRECYEKDIVVVLRSPEFNEIDYMKSGSTLISMLHYPTRPLRVDCLTNNGVLGISLDSIRNDFLERMVVNYNGTSGNGVELSFKALSESMKDFYSKDRDVIHVSIIGLGMVGLMAAKSARKFGCDSMNDSMIELGAKGVLVKMLPKNITCDVEEMISLMKETDILVDATTRVDSTKYIIENKYLGYLKQHAVILDLTADPYLQDVSPIQVKAIEGIPTGTLDNPIIFSNDDLYNNLPKGVSSINRRTVVSCNAWPGIRPQECMDLYGKQLNPILKRILRKDITTFNELSDNYFERAIYRATIDHFQKFEKIL
jgi:alanine dehydrogenase